MPSANAFVPTLRHQLAISAVGVALAGTPLPSQTLEPRAPAAAATRTLAGVVSSSGVAVGDANVFVLETLEGAMTGADGRFQFEVRTLGAFTLVVRRLGFREARVRVPEVGRDTLMVELGRGGLQLDAVHVQASRYSASDERGSTLTPLEVVTTPGTAGNVNRALQMLPGVQPADEGTGLFVRGGDYTETKVYIDGAELLAPVRLQRHLGTFVGTVDPFLLDGIVFSSGGFGARHGNALSGIAALRTLGRPERRAATVSAGLAAQSLSAAIPLGGTSGVRVAANRFDLRPMLWLNGSRQAYSSPPNGHDVSGALHRDYSATGRLKLFMIRQVSGLGLEVENGATSGRLASDTRAGLAVLTWMDAWGILEPSASVSRSTHRSAETLADFRLTTEYVLYRAAAELEAAVRPNVVFRAGTEIEELTARLTGVLARQGNADHAIIATQEPEARAGAFVEADILALGRLRLLPGLRADRSARPAASAVTVDPRFAASLALTERITLTSAWGVYHQRPDPLLYAEPLGDSTLAPARAAHVVVGGQLDAADGVPLARVELYRKQYGDLAGLTREYRTTAGGTGSAAGIDVFVRGLSLVGVTSRVTYSAVRSRRTDPNTGLVAASPFDVTHALAAVLERTWAGTWNSALAWRASTGRPITPVVHATRTEGTGGEAAWVPSYGAPFSERLPGSRRLDLTASRMYRAENGWQWVGYVALTNALDHPNVHDWRYSADYTERSPVRSLFTRSLYFGGSVTAIRPR